jgi:hypothetical protein
MSDHLFWKVMPVAAVALFFTNLTNFAYQAGLASIEPYLWIVGIGAVAAPFAMAAFIRSGLRIPPLAIWCYGYGILTLAWFFRSATPGGAYDELQIRLLSIAFILIALFICSTPRALLRARQAIVVAVLVGIAINLYELFNPETFSDVLGRSAGLYVNPNQSGSALVLGMIVSVSAVRERFRPLFMVATGIGVLTTFSRSAMVAWVIAFGLTCAFTLLRFHRIRGLAEVGLAGFAALVLFLSPGWTAVQARLEDESVLNNNVLDRVSSLSLAQFDDDSATERVSVAEQAWDAFAVHPFVGLGTGASMVPPFDVGPHNIYLALMVDHGLIGLLVFPVLVLACIWSAATADRQLAVTFAAAALVLGFFSHNLLSERYALVTYAVMGSVTAMGRPFADVSGRGAA